MFGLNKWIYEQDTTHLDYEIYLVIFNTYSSTVCVLFIYYMGAVHDRLNSTNSVKP